MEKDLKPNAEFERCVDFLVQMIELYGKEVLNEAEFAETKVDKGCVVA